MEQDYAIKLCNDLCDVINNNPMPISIKYFIIKDMFNEVQMAYNQYCASITNIAEEKTETKKVTIPVEYTEEELEALRKKKQ